ncbi:hypothetical protein PUN28_003385 [Cardiocondyla obscurior]|uniref:Uncharacterized protein n=1 Tax=Cardiocondyla obscurior TaxID=286306 RepID=A0AAW2GJD6_9HYME
MRAPRDWVNRKSRALFRSSTRRISSPNAIDSERPCYLRVASRAYVCVYACLTLRAPTIRPPAFLPRDVSYRGCRETRDAGLIVSAFRSTRDSGVSFFLLFFVPIRIRHATRRYARTPYMFFDIPYANTCDGRFRFFFPFFSLVSFFFLFRGVISIRSGCEIHRAEQWLRERVLSPGRWNRK